jgi:hypothetical protein
MNAIKFCQSRIAKKLKRYVQMNVQCENKEIQPKISFIIKEEIKELCQL